MTTRFGWRSTAPQVAQRTSPWIALWRSGSLSGS